MAGQAAASVIATDDLDVARALQSVMQRGLFRICTNDVIGCELGGALKNVVAISMEMPVCQEVYRVLTGAIPASDAYRGLRIPASHEREPG